MNVTAETRHRCAFLLCELLREMPVMQKQRLTSQEERELQTATRQREECMAEVRVRAHAEDRALQMSEGERARALETLEGEASGRSRVRLHGLDVLTKTHLERIVRDGRGDETRRVQVEGLFVAHAAEERQMCAQMLGVACAADEVSGGRGDGG